MVYFLFKSIFLMQFTEGAVGFHLGDDGVDKCEEIILPFAHQHTDFAVGERFLDERGSETRVILHVPRGLSDFGNHYVGIALGHLIRDFFVLLIDDDGGMRQVLIGELLTITRTSGLSMSASDWKRSASAARQRMVFPLHR